MAAFRPRNELLDTRLRRFTRMLPGVGAGDIRAVHRTRVASRRLRELIPVLQLDSAEALKLVRRLRRVTRRLGRVRELDVLHLLIEELHESGRYPGRALERVMAEVRAARERENAGLSDEQITDQLKKVSRRLERVLTDLADAKTTPAHERSLRWAIDARVASRARTLKDAMTDAGAMYLPERLHAVRIALKKLRYGVELANEACGAGRSQEVRTLKRAQDLLGRMRDLQVLANRVRDVQASLTPADVIAWRELDTVVAGLETSCRRLHARYVRERATLTAICERLGTRTASTRGAAARAAATRKAG